jgi:hypothetical protein
MCSDSVQVLLSLDGRCKVAMGGFGQRGVKVIVRFLKER